MGLHRAKPYWLSEVGDLGIIPPGEAYKSGISMWSPNPFLLRRSWEFGVPSQLYVAVPGEFTARMSLSPSCLFPCIFSVIWCVAVTWLVPESLSEGTTVWVTVHLVHPWLNSGVSHVTIWVWKSKWTSTDYVSHNAERNWSLEQKI